MFRALWWIWHRVIWALLPLPSGRSERDRVLADRAWKVLRTHFKGAGTIRRSDPYTSPMTIDVDRPKVAMQGIRRASAILKNHSLPGHLMNALLRQMDPGVKAQASQQPEYRPPEATPVDGSTSMGNGDNS